MNGPEPKPNIISDKSHIMLGNTKFDILSDSSNVVMGNSKVIFSKLFRFQCGCGEELGYLDAEFDFDKLDPKFHVMAVQMIQQSGMNLVLPRGERHTSCLRVVSPSSASRSCSCTPKKSKDDNLPVVKTVVQRIMATLEKLLRSFFGSGGHG